ncbi:MAG: hypothetical protein E3K32_03255 [wastewater metagenome]|nr:hypothetical protein [Candidatus Loosdrechtia aerotolerans]
MKLIHIPLLQRIVDVLKKRLKQWKYYLPIINLAFLIGAASLAVIGIVHVYYPPERIIKSEQHGEGTPANEVSLPLFKGEAKTIDYYEPILSSNPFSPERTAWISPGINKSEETINDDDYEMVDAEQTAQITKGQQKPKGMPVKITLQGILVLGDVRKALIENPDKTGNKKAFIFVEEGEEIADYTVKRIEEDLVRLDWYGEEQIVVMRPNLK